MLYLRTSSQDLSRLFYSAPEGSFSGWLTDGDLHRGKLVYLTVRVGLFTHKKQFSRDTLTTSSLRRVLRAWKDHGPAQIWAPLRRLGRTTMRWVLKPPEDLRCTRIPFPPSWIRRMMKRPGTTKTWDVVAYRRQESSISSYSSYRWRWL